MTTSFDQLKVLVVHNSNYMRKLIVDMLDLFGFNDVVMIPSTDAYKILRFNKVDLIISQYEDDIPVGLKLVKTLRTAQDNLNTNAPIMLITLSAEEEGIIQRALDCGANAVIASPFNYDEFYSALNAVLYGGQSPVKSAYYAGPDRRNRENRPIGQRERRSTEIAAPFLKAG